MPPTHAERQLERAIACGGLIVNDHHRAIGRSAAERTCRNVPAAMRPHRAELIASMTLSAAKSDRKCLYAVNSPRMRALRAAYEHAAIQGVAALAGFLGRGIEMRRAA